MDSCLGSLSSSPGWLPIGLSGGMDSVCLLHALGAAYPQKKIAAVHVCHHLRPESELHAEKEKLLQVCLREGTPLYFHHLDGAMLQADAGKLGGLESAARIRRYEAFEEVLGRVRGEALVLAHHEDDNLETQVMAFVQGLGLRALAGIPRARIPYLRPFLEISRSFLEEWAHQEQLFWSEDSSNGSDDFVRNRIRHHIMGPLDSLFPEFRSRRRAATKVLSRDADCLDSLAANFKDWRLVSTGPEAELHIASSFFSLHPSLRERALRRMVLDLLAEHGGSHPEGRLDMGGFGDLITGELPGPRWELWYHGIRFSRSPDGIVAGSSIVRSRKNRYLMFVQLDFDHVLPGLGTLRVSRTGPKAGEQADFLEDLAGTITLRLHERSFGPEVPSGSAVLASEYGWYVLFPQGGIKKIEGTRTFSSPDGKGLWVYRYRSAGR